jgi:hypothetical protein
MPDEVVKVPLLAISLEAKFNQSRSVVFQTHIPLDADPKEIYKQFSKVCEIADRREEFYLLKGLRITLERDEAQLKSDVEKVANLEAAYQNEWMAGGRKGAFELKGQQRTNVDNQRGSLVALKERIEKVKSEIAELEKLQKAYE